MQNKKYHSRKVLIRKSKFYPTKLITMITYSQNSNSKTYNILITYSQNSNSRSSAMNSKKYSKVLM